jgi:hypothetical protein
MSDDLQEELKTLLSADPESWEVAIWLLGAVPNLPIIVVLFIAVIVAISVLVGRSVISKAAETQTELSVKAAFENRNWDEQFARIIKKAEGEERGKLDGYNANWTKKLDQILEQNRGIERQRLRAASYAKLWACTKPLAIYDDSKLSRKDLKELSDTLTEWYFSSNGGMMLTKHVRELYFTLQSLLRATVGNEPNWQAQRCAEDMKLHLKRVLRKNAKAIKSKGGPLFDRDNLDDEYFEQLVSRITPDAISRAGVCDWPPESLEGFERWRNVITTLGDCEIWNDLSEKDRFAVFQQAGSILRTALSKDLETRDL